MLRKLVWLFFIALAPFVLYGIYVLPVFLENGGSRCLKDERSEGYHSDYVWGAIRVKWKYTVVCGIWPPVQDAGNQDYRIGANPKPIPLPGQWQRSHTTVRTRWWVVRLDYVAYTHRTMHHTRIGWRWDDVDDFFLFSIVPVKKLPYNWERILWYRSLG